MWILLLLSFASAEQVPVQTNSPVELQLPHEGPGDFTLQITIHKIDDIHDKENKGYWDPEEYVGYLSGHLQIILKHQDVINQIWDVYINETTPSVYKPDICFQSESVEEIAVFASFLAASPLFKSDFTVNVSLVNGETACELFSSADATNTVNALVIVVIILVVLVLIGVLLGWIVFKTTYGLQIRTYFSKGNRKSSNSLNKDTEMETLETRKQLIPPQENIGNESKSILVSAANDDPEDLEAEVDGIICRPEPVRVTTNLTITILSQDQSIMSPHPKEDDMGALDPLDDAFAHKSQEAQEATEEGEQTGEQEKLATEDELEIPEKQKQPGFLQEEDRTESKSDLGTEMEVKGDLQCNGQRCGDNVPLWDDESLKIYESVVICTTCKNDEDEQNYVYHPHCSEAFHNKKKNKGHDLSDIKAAELKGLSEAERKLVLNCTENVVAIVGSSVLSTGVNASVGAIVAGAARAASNYGTGVLNLADEVAAIGGNLSPGAAVGIGAGVSGALAVIEVGYYAYRWANGQMDSQEFKVNCIKAAVGNFSACACGAIGALIGSFVPVVGSIVGGIIGGIVGTVANYASRRIVDWAFDDGEDEKRAQLILEAMYLLDTPVLKLLNEGIVKSCFRRLALTCHPDSVKVINSNEEDKAAALLQWEILKHAKDVLLAFLENSHKYSDRCKGIIVSRYKGTKEPMMSFVILQSHMVKAKNSKSGALAFKA